MCLGREKSEVYAISYNKFMTTSILESIGMNDTKIFYDHFQFEVKFRKITVVQMENSISNN